jgi:membrane protease YdiL (CAAX protease family)
MNPDSSNLLKQHPLPFFFILAYGFAWIPLVLRIACGREIIPLGIGVFAPALSAVILAAVNEGRTGIQGLISKLFLWRVHFKWYLIALLAPVVIELLAIPIHRLLGDAIPSFEFANWIRMLPSQLPGLVAVLLFLMLFSVGEELGWRGYAMPGLQVRYGPVWASIILGLLWGFWHLPLFWIPGTSQYGLSVPGFILATIGYSFIYTCILNGTKGSVLLVSLFHSASNLAVSYGNALFPSITLKLYLSLPALAVLVILVVVLSGPGVWVGRQPSSNSNLA